MRVLLQAAAQMELCADAMALLDGASSPGTALQALLAAGCRQDALKLLARLLPRRYAVAWACQCAHTGPLEGEDRMGVLLAEAWVRDPSDGARRAAMDFASANGYRTLGAWLAAGAAWSGGSLAPPAQATPVPPAEHLTARAVVAAINLIAARTPAAFEERRLAFIEQAAGLLEDPHAIGMAVGDG